MSFYNVNDVLRGDLRSTSKVRISAFASANIA